ncbi:MAG: uracil-DNA glycosylase [Acidobacteria bacterium]|nr:uracil-DNA glycosylase [Acidobacteriota bacterium]
MDIPLQPWRDTLEDLGLAGLVRDPPALPSPAPRPPSEARPPRPGPGVPPAVQPDGPGARPDPAAVAAAPSLEALQTLIQDCQACPLGAGRIRLVFGEGNPSAKLLFVGEGPGRDEDLQGRPFVGRAGELLDRMIASIGLQRTEVWIGNVVKCRPPDNRTPTPQECQACSGYLRRQIELIRPRVIVTLGATPLRELLGITTGITRIRGQWQRLEMLGGIPVMPTFHPAYVLRQYTQEVRRAVWEDLKAAKNWADGPGEAGAAPS